MQYDGHRPPTPNVRRVPNRQVMSGDPIAELRARFIADQEDRLMSTLCATCNKHRDRRGALCDECTFNRRLAFQRYRFETGQMSEWVAEPAVVPRPITPVGHGSLDDWSPESIQLAVSRHG